MLPGFGSSPDRRRRRHSATRSQADITRSVLDARRCPSVGSRRDRLNQVDPPHRGRVQDGMSARVRAGTPVHLRRKNCSIVQENCSSMPASGRASSLVLPLVITGSAVRIQRSFPETASMGRALRALAVLFPRSVRRDVLVEAEEVGRIVGALERLQPLVRTGTVRLPDPIWPSSMRKLT